MTIDPRPAAGPSAQGAPGPTGTMRAVTARRYGPPGVLQVEEMRIPPPGAGDVLVRVGAVSVSRAETAMRAADPPVARLATGLRRPRNPVPGSELAGEVVAVGPRVTGLRPGDRVLGATGAAGGAAAEYARVPAAGLVTIPTSLSAPDAVALTEGGLTALPFLRDAGRVVPGQSVCVNGAVGSVGAAAVQLAVALGARVTAVCSARNAELALALGAARVVDYTTADVTAEVDAFDVFFDAVGTLSFRRVRGSLRHGGTYLSTVPSAGIAWHTLTAAVPGSRRRGRIALTGLRRPEQKAADLRRMLDLADRGLLRPVLDRAYPFAEVAAAHAYVETGRKRGTVVLVP
ncbi:NAD(P)-dependent alcohol dehydrogenase [Georgenia sp. MJ206]|uniref:NAD(P)-dependent alcohol dehydrogenase n=1 Tax=Georgenia wangjunii TaxID=3117730 RepID=UPI002F269E7A